MNEPLQIRPRLRWSLTTALAGAVSVLIAAAVGGVLLVALGSGRQNTFALLLDKTDLGMQLLEARISGELEPVMGAATGIGTMIASGQLAPEDHRGIRAIFSGALATLPRATAMEFTSRQAEVVSMVRSPDGSIQPGHGPPPEVRRENLRRTEAASGPFWTPPHWVRPLRSAGINVVVPVRNADGALIGVVAALVALTDINAFLETFRRDEGLTAFILYDGMSVLAHPDLIGYDPPTNVRSEPPLPALVATSDSALLLADQDEALLDDVPAAFQEAFASFRIDDRRVVLLRESTAYGDRPWQLGLSFDRAELGREVERLEAAGAIGLGILVLALGLALVLGRRVAGRIGELSTTAHRLTTLDIAHTKLLPDSRIRELANAARAFNALIGAMRWFERYVPTSLVLGLMHQGDEATESEERELTIMFTDIRGFSALAEDKRPSEIAGLLNQHFEMMAGCIEDEGGTVDKFIGDSIMAFWGAPEPMSDHRSRGLRAARAICRAVNEKLLCQRTDGGDEVAVRVGLHTGPVIVGNIGSKSRVNYTVVGDAVNTASRLQALAKEIAPDDDCVVLVSEATATGAPDDIVMTSVGAHVPRGRRGTINVYRLG